MLHAKRFITLFTLVAVVLSACQPITRPAASASQPPQGLRPDAPPYAVRGPFAVGERDFVVGESEDALQVGVWYPGLNPTNAKEEITYQISEKAGSLPPLPPASLIVLGQAIADAIPDPAQEPYPLVIFAPGLGGFRQQYSYLLEHLASYGMVVMAADPRGETLFGEFWAGAATRPLDTKRTIDFAEELTAPGGEWAGLIDTEHIALVGHSSGGWSALAGGGAQMDLGWCSANPDLVAEGTDCTQFPLHQEEIAAMLGLAAAPQGLWPATNDPRVDAVIALAPDGDIWGTDYGGVEVMTIPTLVMAGSQDTVNVPELTSYPIYEHVGSATKSLVVLENADHFVFFQRCRYMPWMADNFPYFVCSDPVWDMDRAHDLINHFATAFLLAELKGDPEAAQALAPENVAFPGVRYETTGYGPN